MRFVFDIQDEQDILKEMSRNRDRAESMGRICVQQGKANQAASWARSAQLVSIKIMLLEQAFQHKS